MKFCCAEAGARFFAARYPLAGSVEDDHLTAGLLRLCDRWGGLELAERFYVRSTSSLGIGVNAETGWLRCDTCEDSVPYAFIGSRLLSFMWRVNMVCATYWDAVSATASDDVQTLVGSTDWPRTEHIEQLRIAISMYFGDDPVLGTEGLAELNQHIFALAPAPGVIHQHIVDFAELFVLFHELQHQAPILEFGDTQLGVKVHLPTSLTISSKRFDWWTAELTHDANAVYILLLLATSILGGTLRMQTEDARAQAGSLVLAGADSALHSLQVLEKIRFGTMDLQSAGTSNAFVRHPPSSFRRDHLSQVAFSLVTGKSSESLLRRDFTEAWKMVAGNVASQMKVWDLLLDAYAARQQDALAGE